MQWGYSLCTKDKKKILAIKKTGKGVKLLNTDKYENLNQALCLKSLTAIKDVYSRFKKMELVEDLDIVNISELYKTNN